MVQFDGRCFHAILQGEWGSGVLDSVVIMVVCRVRQTLRRDVYDWYYIVTFLCCDLQSRVYIGWQECFLSVELAVPEFESLHRKTQTLPLDLNEL